MTQFKTSNGEYILVEVPKDAYGFEWVTNQSEIPYKPALQYFIKCEKTGLPQGETVDIGFPFTFLCTTDNISEEVASSIVGDYAMPLVEFANIMDNNNLSHFKNYAICKKN